MSPVRKQIRPPVDVQVVKFIPKPNRIMVLVQIDDHVSGYCCPGNDLLVSLQSRSGARWEACTKSWCVPMTVILQPAQVAAASALLRSAAVICQISFPGQVHFL